MSAPWEEEWVLREQGGGMLPPLVVRTVEPLPGLPEAGRHVATPATPEGGRFIAAAPAMARALLRVVELPCATIALLGDDCATAFDGKPEERCRVCEASAGLAEAGVPLP